MRSASRREVGGLALRANLSLAQLKHSLRVDGSCRRQRMRPPHAERRPAPPNPRPPRACPAPSCRGPASRHRVGVWPHAALRAGSAARRLQAAAMQQARPCRALSPARAPRAHGPRPCPAAPRARAAAEEDSTPAARRACHCLSANARCGNRVVGAACRAAPCRDPPPSSCWSRAPVRAPVRSFQPAQVALERPFLGSSSPPRRAINNRSSRRREQPLLVAQWPWCDESEPERVC